MPGKKIREYFLTFSCYRWKREEQSVEAAKDSLLQNGGIHLVGKIILLVTRLVFTSLSFLVIALQFQVLFYLCTLI
jgi:hypothetical protein